MGLGSDGATVMMGRRTEVGVQLLGLNRSLLHIHCFAHRMALVVSQTAAAIDRLKTIQDTVNYVYFYFHNSAIRNRLR